VARFSAFTSVALAAIFVVGCAANESPPDTAMSTDSDMADIPELPASLAQLDPCALIDDRLAREYVTSSQRFGEHRAARMESIAEPMCTIVIDIGGRESVTVQAKQATVGLACTLAADVSLRIEPSLPPA
jgi:hypothetical protein